MVKFRKKDIRKLLISKRKKISTEEVKRVSKLIIEQIVLDPNYQRAKTVGIYMPINNEIDLTALTKDKSRIFVVPKIINNNNLIFVKIDEKSEFKLNRYNILEPISDENIIEIDYLLVPAVAIYNNYRLGYGGGHYDRYLSHVRPKKIVGVIYQFQEEEFKIDRHDQVLDYYFKAWKSIFK